MSTLKKAILAVTAAIVGILGIRAITPNNAEEVDTPPVTADAAIAGTDEDIVAKAVVSIEPPEPLEIDVATNATYTPFDGVTITVEDGHVTLHMSANDLSRAGIGSGHSTPKEDRILAQSPFAMADNEIFNITFANDPKTGTNFSPYFYTHFIGDTITLDIVVNSMLNNVEPDSSWREKLTQTGVTDQAIFNLVKDNKLLPRKDSAPSIRSRIGEVTDTLIRIGVIASEWRPDAHKEAALAGLRLTFQQPPAAGTQIQDGQGVPAQNTPQRAVGGN